MLSWLVGVIAFGVLAARFGKDWSVPLVLWVVGHPLIVAAWTSTAGPRGTRKRLERAGCLVLAFFVTLLIGFMVLWAMAVGEMVSGI